MRAMLRRDDFLLPPSCLNWSSPMRNASNVCEEQELRLGTIYTFGAWANQGGRFLIGVLVDHIGPRESATLSALLFAVGTLIFAASASTAALSAGFFVVGFGGAGVQLAVQSVSTLFPRNKSTAMASMSGAFQFASGAYLILDSLHQTGLPLAVGLLCHAGIALLVSVITAIVFPSVPFGKALRRGTCCSRLQNGADTGVDEVGPPPPPPSAAAAPPRTSGGGATFTSISDASSAENNSSSGKPGTRAISEAATLPPLKARSFGQQARSPEYIFLVCYFSINVLQAQFTVATIGLQHERIAAAAMAVGATGVDAVGAATAATRWFSGCLMCSFVWTPMIGVVSDRLGFGCSFSLISCLLLGCLVCLLIPSMPLTYLASLLYAVGRVSLWATYFGYALSQSPASMSMCPL